MNQIPNHNPPVNNPHPVDGHNQFSFQSIWQYEIKVSQIVYLAAGLLVVQILWNMIIFVYRWIYNLYLKRKGRRYREQRDEQIKNFIIPAPNVDQETIQKVLDGDVTLLKSLLSKNKVTSEDLVNIFAKRCQLFGVQYGIITHLKYEEAIRQAKECDKLRKEKSSQCSGYLFGIPISIKEVFDEKGYPSTIGSIQRLNHIPLEDGFIIQLIRKSGAIPFLRTNVPQVAFTFESTNDIYGRVQNPWNKTKYAGGSSGGEGAAIAARLSPLGLGSDQGGSIRIPSALNGIYGFKPTSERSVINGHTFYSEIFDGQRINKTCSGPMGKSMEDIILMFKALCDPQILKEFNISEKDPNLVELPIDEQALKDNRKKRRFGYFKTLQVVDACVSAQRAVDISIEKLRNVGHEVIEVELPGQTELINTFLQNAFSDDLVGLTDILKGEYEYKLIDFSSSLPNCVKKAIASLAGCLGEKRLKERLLSTLFLNSFEYKRVCYSIIDLRKQCLKIFDENKIEAIICPAFCTPALEHGSSANVSDVAIFSFIWNILNFPCGVLPITKVEENEQHYDNSRIKDSISKGIAKQMKKQTEGLPIGVQVVTPPFKEETCLNVMRVIDSAVQFYKYNSFPLLEGEASEVELVVKD